MRYRLIIWSYSLPLVAWSLWQPTINHQMLLMRYEPWFPNNYIESDWKNIAYSNFITTGMGADYLMDNNNLNLSHPRNFIRKHVAKDTWYSQGYITIGQINWQNYASSRQSFINNYNLNINYNLGYNSHTNDWGWSNPIYGSDGTNLRFNNYNFTSQIIENTHYKAQEYIEHGRKTHSKILFNLQWNGNKLQVQTKLESKTWWTWGSWVEHGALISFKLSNINIVSKFSNHNLQTRLTQAFNQNFVLNTKTSPLISSDNKISVDGIVKSNQEIINDEINKRLQFTLDHDYNEWSKRLSIQKQFINNHNIVKLTFIDAHSKVPQHIKDCFQNLVLKVKVNLLPQFWQQNLKERMEIAPGKIVNPKKSFNELMTDNPEFIKEGNHEIYVYHNSVKVTFTSTANSGEILFINGKEVEVYENIFKTELLDKGTEKEADNTYEIVVKKNNQVKMTLTIKIKTEGKDTTFRWLGWKPENNPLKPNEYKQFKLISPTINGEENDEYDPTINPQTGLRNQIIFVNQKTRYPFPLNPLDQYGRLIKENKNDYIQGYIAEAMVANSGIENIFNEEDLKMIEKIERVKINAQSFAPISDVENVDIKKEMQFSLPGLWHYIYHVKDYVDQKVDPKDTNYKSLFPSGGSTMHKFVLIGNQLSDYAEFLQQKDLFNNTNIESFWSSVNGNHLKNFLKNERNINLTQQVHKFAYKNIVRYWKEYVSTAVKEQIDHKKEITLFDLSQLKLRTWRTKTNEQKVLLKSLIEHLKLALKAYVTNIVYDVDYYITNHLGQNLNQINWEEFLNINENNVPKKMQLLINSSNQSLHLKGKTTIEIINDYKYDPKKLLDLSTIKFPNITYNFFDTSDEIKRNFKQNYINNYVLNILNKNKLKIVKENYKYELDYYVLVIFPNKKEITLIDPTIDKELEEFLKTEKYQTLTIKIIANTSSYLLKNNNSYNITNDPDEIIAPPDPKIIDDQDNLTRNLMWIIPTAIGGIAIISLTVFFVVRRFKRKIK